MVKQAVTAKLTILVTLATKRRLQAEARAQKITVGELVRRRIDGEPSAEEQHILEALAAWGRRAKSVLAQMAAADAELQRERANWPAREAEIRAATLAKLTENDRAALASWFTHPSPTR